MGNFDRTRWFNSIFKMDIKIWLSVLLAVITLGTPASSSEPRVVCYYTNWSVYRPGTARFNPQNINPYLCTHLIYAFGGFTKDNTLKPFDKYQDIEKGGYAKFTGLKTYNKNLKTLLAIGGWNEGSSRFSPMVASRDKRKEFVRNVIKFLRQNRFDGLDLDWEYPAFRDGSKPKDRENYARLVKELREEFDRESEKTGRPRLLLTMAVPAGIEYIQKGFDVETLNRYLDWMNLLTYDYHSAFEPAVNHHAPLFPTEEPNEYSVDNELNIDYTIKFYLENGADADKLVLGIPTYGRSYTLFNPDAVEIGSPADGPGEQGDATREKGYLAYYEICESLKPKAKKKRNAASDEDSEEYDDEEEEEATWTVMHPYPEAMGPVAYKGNQWVGYDDIDIVKKKAEYVAENGLGGIMFWSIDNDDFRGACHDKPYPLIEAAKEAYYQRLGSTVNAITEKPRSATRSSTRKSRPKTTITTTTQKPSKTTKRVTSTTPSWNITPEPPTTPDPGSDFKCVDEGFFPHPRDCKKYFWCLDSGPSQLGIVAHSFTCPSGLYFNKAADSCDFARNVLCKTTTPTTKAPATKPATTKTTTTTRTTPTPTTTTTTRRPLRLSTKNSALFRTTTTTTTTSEPESEYEEEVTVEEDAEEDPRVIKELIDLIKKVGGIEQLEKQLHLDGPAVSTDGAITTTPSSFSKKLYQKVLERTRGKNKFTGKQSFESLQNSRRGPQNAGLEPSSDRDTLVRKDRPQYTSINRQRGSTTTEEPVESNEDDEQEEDEIQVSRAKSVESRPSVATTAKPLQYVNIRRGRPNTGTSDTADDTASRNALFERAEPVTVSEIPNTLNVLNARRENVPEYVTIRRQRPTTEETTTVQYQNSQEEEDELQETALEREISTQPQYNIIVRSRSTLPPAEPSTETPLIRVRSTTISTETPSVPDPTTVLAVQISSLLNSANSYEIDTDVETAAPTTEAVEPTTASTTTTTTTTTTTRAPFTPTRRTNIIRRRGSTTTSAPTVSTTTQVSPRNYTITRRRRPLRRPNEISSDSDDSNDLSRKIRSTTPDSREVDAVTETGRRRFRGRVQASQARIDDSVPAAASPVTRGQFRAEGSSDEIISLTPIDVEPKFVPRQSFNSRAERRFRRPTASTVVTSETAADSEASAATVEVRRPNLLPRGRNRFTLVSTTDATIPLATTAALAQRRPTFARFTPRPFTRASPPPPSIDDNLEGAEEVVTQRIITRLPFGRTRPTPAIVARKLPFPSRQPTTPQTLVTDDDEEEIEDEDKGDDLETKSDDILLSESARNENEHNEAEPELETEAPKRRVIIKKLRAPSPTEGEIISTETVPIDESGKKRFRVIRRRPTSTTAVPEPVVTTEIPTGPGPQRIRKIIRKKIRPAENEPEITGKSISSLNVLNYIRSSTTTELFNYGEKTRAPPTTTTTEVETEPTIEEVTEFYKEEKVASTETQQGNIDTKVELDTKEIDTEKMEEIKQEEKIVIETTTTPVTIQSESNTESEHSKNIDVISDTVIETQSNDERKSQNESKNEGIDGSITSSEEESKKEINSNSQAAAHVEVAVTTEEKNIIILENKDDSESESPITETEAPQTETTTVSTTVSTSPPGRSRLPYRPRKKLFTSSTEPSIPSSSRTFSRKFNPGVYTSPATADKPKFRPSGSVTRRPFSSKIFTRRPFTPRTTQKLDEEDEYRDDEDLEGGDELNQANPFVFVPPNQLFTRKPDSNEENDDAANSEELLEEGDADENYEGEQDDDNPSKFTTRRPGFKPRVVNSNTFRTSTTTTEIPKRLGGSQNRTGIITRFSVNKPATDKKRVQNVPPGYNSPVNAPKPKGVQSNNETQQTDSEDFTTTINSVSDTETTTVDDDYLTATYSTDGKEITSSDEVSTTNTIQTETATAQMEIDDSTDDYLEYTEGTTNYPSTQDISTYTQTEPVYIPNSVQNIVTNIVPYTETTTQQVTTVPVPVAPIIKTQFNKLFSVSRVVEVNSKLDKHRLNKNNETTLVEEGKIMVEKKPVLDKIGEVSRYSLIKIVEDEIPIYLTKFGHIYPVENPPDNIIRIDEARNARALDKNGADIPRENLVASESINEAYRHVHQTDSQNPETKGHIEHVPNDDFLSYVNVDKKAEKDQDNPLFAQWQFVPAAYENEKVRAAKSFEIVTPRSMLTNPSTLPLEGLFKTETPFMARKVNDDNSQPFVVYSASVPGQQDGANIVKLSALKSETGRSIITFAKGQTFEGSSVKEEATVKYPINISIFPQSEISSTLTVPSTTSGNNVPTVNSLFTTENPNSPIIDLLSTTQSTTEAPSTTEASSTTETVQEETTTVKASPLDAKRGKFAFPRRQILKSSNFTRPSVVPRTFKKINATAVSNLNQKVNKTTFSPSKVRSFSANRAQNVPIDLKKKGVSPKIGSKIFTTTKAYTTESPKTTTERKLYFKPIRPNFRPGFIQRKTTPAPTTGDT